MVRTMVCTMVRTMQCAMVCPMPCQVAKLTALLRPYLLRRTKADVDLGLAPMRETLISVDITNFQKACYRALLEQVAPQPTPHTRRIAPSPHHRIAHCIT